MFVMRKLAICFFLMITGAALFAQQPVVAVTPFNAISGISTADANAITRVFYIRLGNTRQVQLRDSGIVEQVLREHNFQTGDWSNQQKTAELGRALNADWIVRGELEKFGANILVTVQFYDIKTFGFMGGTDALLENSQDAYNKMDPMVNKLVETISVSAANAANVSSSTARAVSSDTVRTAPNTVNTSASNIIQWSTVILNENTDGRSTVDFNINMENIDGREREVLTINANVANGTPKWAEVSINGDSLIQKIKQGSGVKFKVLGDGNGWELLLPTTETLPDSAFFKGTITTRRNRVVEINIPFSRLRQPDWGRKTTFNKNSVFELKFSRNSASPGGRTAVIKIFDFEIY
jgi:TolB-like protein